MFRVLLFLLLGALKIQWRQSIVNHLKIKLLPVQKHHLKWKAQTINLKIHELLNNTRNFRVLFFEPIIVKYGILQNFHLLLAIVLNKLYNIARQIINAQYGFKQCLKYIKMIVFYTIYIDRILYFEK